jgi:hypothetical protein
MDIKDINNLLSNVTHIRKHYEEIAFLTGESFNIFKILKLSTNEVRHSAFIAELLNTKGSHGQKDKYLELFLKQIKLEDFPFDAISAEVKPEFSIGFINEDKTQGGRIDILIEDKNRKRIIIENKIYAGDQKNQLLRYNNFDESALLIYLTLSGDEPSPYSGVGIKSKVLTFSYKNEILNWLEKCLKESASLPIIRESIQQYIYLIRNLTGKSFNKTMGNKLAELMGNNSENVLASFDVWSKLGDLKQYLFGKFIQEFKDFANGYNYELIIIPKDEEGELIIEIKLNDVFRILFGFDKPDNYEGFYFGVFLNDNRTNFPQYNYVPTQLAQISELGIHKTDSFEKWLYFYYFENDIRHWTSPELWASIADGKFFKERIKPILEDTIKLLKTIEN